MTVCACVFWHFVFLNFKLFSFFSGRKLLEILKVFDECEQSSYNRIRATQSLSMNIELYVHASSTLGMNSFLIIRRYLQKRITPFHSVLLSEPNWKPYKCAPFPLGDTSDCAAVYFEIPMTFFVSGITGCFLSAWKSFDFPFKQTNCYRCCYFHWYWHFFNGSNKYSRFQSEHSSIASHKMNLMNFFVFQCKRNEIFRTDFIRSILEANWKGYLRKSVVEL